MSKLLEILDVFILVWLLAMALLPIALLALLIRWLVT